MKHSFSCFIHFFSFSSLSLPHLLHDVGNKDPLVLKTNTQETENLQKAISFYQEGASYAHYS
jgi:hypothetical protein